MKSANSVATMLNFDKFKADLLTKSLKFLSMKIVYARCYILEESEDGKIERETNMRNLLERNRIS